MRRKLTALAFDMQTPGASSQLHALCIWEWRSMFGGWRTPGHRVDEKFQVGPPSNATGDGVGFSFEAANSTCIGEYPARQTCYPRRFHKQSWSSGVEFRFFRCVVTFNRQHGLFHCSEGREWIPCLVVSAALAPELSCWSEAKERSWSPELSFVRPSIWVDTSILLILYLERTWLLKNVYPCCWWYCDEYQKLRDLFFFAELIPWKLGWTCSSLQHQTESKDVQGWSPILAQVSFWRDYLYSSSIFALCHWTAGHLDSLWRDIWQLEWVAHFHQLLSSTWIWLFHFQHCSASILCGDVEWAGHC